MFVDSYNKDKTTYNIWKKLQKYTHNDKQATSTIKGVLGARSPVLLLMREGAIYCALEVRSYLVFASKLKGEGSQYASSPRAKNFPLYVCL